MEHGRGAKRERDREEEGGREGKGRREQGGRRREEAQRKLRGFRQSWVPQEDTVKQITSLLLQRC